MLRLFQLHIARVTMRNILLSRRSLEPVLLAAVTRQYSKYQFKTTIPVYYPDRQEEMKRMQKNREHLQVIQDSRDSNQPKDFYYKILGVTRNASMQQIKQAFYALAKRFHPDSTHSEEKLNHFQELSNAYNILTDETKRLEYDQLGTVRDEQTFLEHARNPITKSKPVSDRKSELSKKLNKANDIDFMKINSTDPDLNLLFAEGAVGCNKRVDVKYLRKCENCNGKSKFMAHRNFGNEICRRCNGTGQIAKRTLIEVCSRCKGKRFINRNNCDTCENRGYILSTVQVLVKVPSGSVTGDTVTVDNPITKQHINFHLKVAESNYFRRVGNNIYSEKYLNISEAILGGYFKVRGLYEDIDIKVSPGTQSHTEVVLHNKGVRTSNNIGNHIIRLIVYIPQKLSVTQHQLILALAKTEEPIYVQPGGNELPKSS